MTGAQAFVVARVDFLAIFLERRSDKEIDDSFRCTRDKFPADALKKGDFFQRGENGWLLDSWNER